MTIVVYVIIAFYLFLVLNSMGAVMLDNRQPVKTIAWLLVILLIPIIGLLFYYFFGQEKPGHVDAENDFALCASGEI